jgi:hypothetical protein
MHATGLAAPAARRQPKNWRTGNSGVMRLDSQKSRNAFRVWLSPAFARFSMASGEKSASAYCSGISGGMIEMMRAREHSPAL